ncbi:MAG: TIGR04282 family arsenosugar biosynthesis glycosyltransferase [bacterium]
MKTSPESSKRAILLFTRSPENEARSKPLSERLSFAERVALYESFTRHVLEQSSRLSCPIIIAADEPTYNFSRFSSQITAVLPQHGASFGEKFTAAISEAFSLGYEEVVCVGNDCLELTASDLQTTFEKLASHSLVLGAATDGGVYLIGVHQRDLTTVLRAFEDCHWQTAIVLADLSRAANTFDISICILRKHADIDTAFDLITASRRLPSLIFLKRFAGKLSHSQDHFSVAQHSILLSHHIDRLRYQKAPPTVLIHH